MGIQTMGSHSQTNGQEALLQPSPLTRQSSWYNLTLEEVGSQLGNLGKPLGSMNLDELLKNVGTAEANQCTGMDKIGGGGASPSSSLRRHSSLTLARALSGKTVDEVWKEIKLGQKKRYTAETRVESGEQELGDVTLEDFLVQAGLSADASLNASTEMDVVDVATPLNFTPQIGLSPAPSIGSLSDTTASRRKRDDPDTYEKALERRLRRKIKNRESAARSRARKQAYHNELVNKISCLEEENTRLKKEKEFDAKLQPEYLLEPKYQLRRTILKTTGIKHNGKFVAAAEPVTGALLP